MAFILLISFFSPRFQCFLMFPHHPRCQHCRTHSHSYDLIAVICKDFAFIVLLNYEVAATKMSGT